MAICLRTVSNKLTPIKKFVSQGKHVTFARSERLLPVQVSKSLFLDEFLTPSCVNINDSITRKQTDGKKDQCSSYVDSSEICNCGISDAAVHVGSCRLEDEFLRNDRCSNTKPIVDSRPTSGNIDAARSLHCFDPLSVAVKYYSITPDDILWNADTSTEVLKTKDEVCYELMNFTCATSKSHEHIFFSDKGKESTVMAENAGQLSQTPKQDPSKPTEEQLRKVHSVLSEWLPNLFAKPIDYSIYHQDIVFEDNIRGKRTVGLVPYTKQIILLKTAGHLKFAYIKFEILKITMHPEDGTVKLRWRIRGLSSWRVLITFWKYRLWRIKDIFEAQEAWYDGFSTFYVGGDGLVYKHVADKMMPDDDRVPHVKNTPLVAKLALFVGAASQQGLTELDSILTFLNSSLKLRCISSIKLPVSKVG